MMNPDQDIVLGQHLYFRRGGVELRYLIQENTGSKAGASSATNSHGYQEVAKNFITIGSTV